MSKLKNLIIFYPSIEIGGATAIFYNLVEIFSKKKVHVCICSENLHNEYMCDCGCHGRHTIESVLGIFCFEHEDHAWWCAPLDQA